MHARVHIDILHINNLSVAHGSLLHKIQNFSEIELRKGEIENVSGG